MLANQVKSRLPSSVKASLGRIVRAARTVLVGGPYYLRARRILRAYAIHYRRARRVFCERESVVLPIIDSVQDLGVRIFRPGAVADHFVAPGDYLTLVERVSNSARSLLDRSRKCVFVPPLRAGENGVDRTEEIPAVRRGELLMIRIEDPLEADGVEELVAPIVQQLEQRLFGSYLLVDRVYVYRNPVSHARAEGAWLWHYDNHPHEVAKVMIYLTDVERGNGPFEYLRSARTARPAYGPSIAPLYGNSRVSHDRLNRYFEEGYECKPVTGPMGTSIVFDNNVVHRANLARDGRRDVLLLQVRPVPTRIRPFLHRSRTGSFQHVPFAVNPDDLRLSTHRRYHFS